MLYVFLQNKSFRFLQYDYCALPFLTKMHSSCNKSYKIEYKATVMVFFIIVLTVHKYEESNIEFNVFLNCCKLGKCIPYVYTSDSN